MTDKPPVMFIELCEKRNSGFVKQGTQGTSFHEELNCPNMTWLPNSGFKAVKENLNGVDTTVYKEIRWIKNCNTIDKEEQEKRNVRPNYYEDKIPVEKGYATVAREGSTIALYDYLYNVFYNENAAGRPDSVAPLFRVVQIDKKAEEIDESDIEMADAIKLVGSLRSLVSGKDKSYKYNEDRLNAICTLCAVHADSIPTKFHALMSLAKAKSRWFLDLVVKYEQTIVTEVTHALELNLIRFDGNTVLGTEGDKVLNALGTGNLSRETKIERFSDFLKTGEGNGILTELRAQREVAKKD